MKTITGQTGKVVCLGIIAAFFMAGAVWSMPSGDEAVKPEGAAKADGAGMSKNREERARKHFAEMAEKLKLTKEQQAQLDENRKKHRAEFEALREQMSAKRKELREALESATLDMTKVESIHNELKALMNKKEDQQLAAILEIRKVLTPEQFVQFQAMAPDRKGPPSKDRPRHGHGK